MLGTLEISQKKIRTKSYHSFKLTTVPSMGLPNIHQLNIKPNLPIDLAIENMQVSTIPRNDITEYLNDKKNNRK